jgi:hypothetical protein
LQAAYDTLAAERKHDREERGRDRLSGQRHTRAVDEHARLYAFLFGEGAQ